jgi:hypothetical protein
MLHLFIVNVPSKDDNVLYSSNNQFDFYWQKRRQPINRYNIE